MSQKAVWATLQDKFSRLPFFSKKHLTFAVPARQAPFNLPRCESKQGYEVVAAGAGFFLDITPKNTHENSAYRLRENGPGH
jgi:hypothetical protein